MDSLPEERGILNAPPADALHKGTFISPNGETTKYWVEWQSGANMKNPNSSLWVYLINKKPVESVIPKTIELVWKGSGMYGGIEENPAFKVTKKDVLKLMSDDVSKKGEGWTIDAKRRTGGPNYIPFTIPGRWTDTMEGGKRNRTLNKRAKRKTRRHRR